ncbi:MAG: putative bifunctional diguanylate cyclase/phosphodiesterase [Lachnospiraceae bacterium]
MGMNHAIYNTLGKSNNSGQTATETEAVLGDILGNIDTGVMVFDIDHRTALFANKIALESEENIRVFADVTKSLMENGGLIPKRAVEFFDSESGIWFDVKFSKLKWLDGRNVVLITSNDATLRKKNTTRSTFQANNDFLTGLFNRMKCENDLQKVLEQTLRYSLTGALLFIDLDNFKNINDGLGHDYGDALLKEIAAKMQTIVGLHNHCYRMGGDEFVVIVTPENYNLLNRILMNLTLLFNRSWYILDSECYCTMSMGVVKFPEQGADVNNLIKKADIAMYEAKKLGKNRYAYYKKDYGDDMNYRQLEMESNMRQAVESSCEEFVLFYQPVVDTATGKCTGCEALVRWNSRSLGFVVPGDFIPLAEYLGLIVEIGDFVLETACVKCKEWNEKYDPDFRINVNLSVVQLLQPNIVEHVKEILETSEVNPKNITLEITETLAINDMERAMKIVTGLKELGVKIALDDFGTGYSSLNYIRQLDFDIIKIDKTFIDDILTDDYDQAFVKLIVDFARKINVKLCVEGVETEEQFEYLRDLEADSIQGYFFSRPITAHDFEEKYFIKH